MTEEDFDTLEELMSEPPGGENFGRMRGPGGGLQRLDRAASTVYEYGFEYFVDIEIHGLRSTYVAGCRCPSCRRAERDFKREYRRRKRCP